nr:PREDICTED: facilitated trehalose transporter Tret1-like [Bemisia tabaci]
MAIDKGKLRQYLAGFIASIGSACFGVAMGWPAPVMWALRDPRGRIRMTAEESSWMVSIMELGNLLSPIPGGVLADRYGRKFVLHLAAPLFAASWIIVLLSKAKLMLYAMRVLQGLATGLVFTLTPMYLGEISKKEHRGTIGSMFSVMMYVGSLYAYVFGPPFSYDVFAMICLAMPTVMFFGFMFIPETPYFYLMVGDLKAARKSLAFFRSKDDPIEEELLLMQESVETDMANKSTFMDLMTEVGNRKALIILQVLSMFKIMTGICALLTYATMTFEETGTRCDANLISISFAVIIVVSTIASAGFVDRCGRRPMLLISSAGLTLTNVLIALYFYELRLLPPLSDYAFIVFAAVGALACFHTIGYGAVHSTIQCEYFPSNTRGLANGITAVTLTVFSFFTLKIFQSIDTYFGMYMNFIVFAAFCFSASVFVNEVVFETKGKSFSEIHAEFRNRVSEPYVDEHHVVTV